MTDKNSYTVERSVTIGASPAEVYEQVADFHNWRKWSPWEDIDPAMNRAYAGTDSGTGAVYTWSGNRKAGQGRMEIVAANQPSSVRIDLQFEKPWKARSDTTFTILPDGSGSRVSWTMIGRKSLLTRMMSIVKSMDSLVGPDFEKGLSRLKATAEGASTS